MAGQNLANETERKRKLPARSSKKTKKNELPEKTVKKTSKNTTKKEKVIVDTLLRWQRTRISARRPLAAVARELGLPATTVRRKLQTGLRASARKLSEKTRIVSAPVAKRAADVFRDGDGSLSSRSVRRIRQPIRKRHIVAKKSLKRKNFVDVTEHEQYSTDRNNTEWKGYVCSQNLWR
jgi:hypothetical protein